MTKNETMTTEHYYISVECICEILEQYLERDGRDADLKALKLIKEETQKRVKLWKES